MIETIKKKVNGKSKGSSFERTIANLFSKQLHPLEFKRSAGSGAVLGGINEKFLSKYSDEIKAVFISDVVCTNESDIKRDRGYGFKFVIECKNYKEVDTLQQLLNNTKITEWFNKADIDAKKINKEPLLIFKFNRTDIFAAVHKITQIPKCVKIKINLTTESHDLIIFKLEEAWNDKEWFKKLVSK